MVEARLVMWERPQRQEDGGRVRQPLVIRQYLCDVSELCLKLFCPFEGELALRQLFEAADADTSGKLDKYEIRTALKKLGFNWMDDEDKVAKVTTAPVQYEVHVSGRGEGARGQPVLQ